MKFLGFVKANWPGLAFLVLIALAFYIYFVVYMTPSRTAWYGEMRRQIIIFYQEVTTIGR